MSDELPDPFKEVDTTKWLPEDYVIGGPDPHDWIVGPLNDAISYTRLGDQDGKIYETGNDLVFQAIVPLNSQDAVLFFLEDSAPTDMLALKYVTIRRERDKIRQVNDPVFLENVAETALETQIKGLRLSNDTLALCITGDTFDGEFGLLFYPTIVAFKLVGEQLVEQARGHLHESNSYSAGASGSTFFFIDMLRLSDSKLAVAFPKLDSTSESELAGVVVAELSNGSWNIGSHEIYMGDPSDWTSGNNDLTWDINLAYLSADSFAVFTRRWGYEHPKKDGTTFTTFGKVWCIPVEVSGTSQTPFTPVEIDPEYGDSYGADHGIQAERVGQNDVVVSYAPRYGITGTWFDDGSGTFESTTVSDDYDVTILESFDSPGSFPWGLKFINGFLWNADHGDAAGDGRDRIYKLDPTDGTVLDNIVVQRHDHHSFLLTVAPHPTDITWDGSNLWVGDTNVNALYKIDISTGSELDHFHYINGVQNEDASSSGRAQVRAIDYYNGTIYTWLRNGDGMDDGVYKIDPANGAITGSLALEGQDSLVGSKLDSMHIEDGVIWAVNSSTVSGRDATLYVWDASTGEQYAVMEEVLPSNDSTNNGTGLAFDGEHFWATDQDNNKIVKFELTPTGETVTVNKALYDPGSEVDGVWEPQGNSRTIHGVILAGRRVTFSGNKPSKIFPLHVIDGAYISTTSDSNQAADWMEHVSVGLDASSVAVLINRHIEGFLGRPWEHSRRDDDLIYVATLKLDNDSVSGLKQDSYYPLGWRGFSSVASLFVYLQVDFAVFPGTRYLIGTSSSGDQAVWEPIILHDPENFELNQQGWYTVDNDELEKLGTDFYDLINTAIWPLGCPAHPSITSAGTQTRVSVVEEVPSIRGQNISAGTPSAHTDCREGETLTESAKTGRVRARKNS